MRSFSSFSPVFKDLSPRQARHAMFAMWLKANAMNIRKPFDRATWRTARPWLTFSQIRFELSDFRARTLGSLQLGNLTLKNADVEKAVKYEAYATRKIFQADIAKMLFSFYEISKKSRVHKRDALNKINEEFAYMNRGTVSERDPGWQKTIADISSGRHLTLKPRMNEHKLAGIILQLFEISDDEIPLEQIKQQLAPCLAAAHETISDPLLRRALSTTGRKLRYREHFEIINGIIKKFYKPHRLAEENAQRLKCIVNQFVNIPFDNSVWNLIDLQITPRHDFESEEYEQAFHEDYHEPPKLAPEQVPFFRHKLPHMWVRKKQNINWLKFINRCKRGRGTDKNTLDKANEMLIASGFQPYAHCHPEFDALKVLGLRYS